MTDIDYPEFRKGFEKRYYSCHCESRVWVSFFRHEEAHAPLPANGKDGGGRAVSSIMPSISWSGYLILTQPPAWIIGKEYA